MSPTRDWPRIISKLNGTPQKRLSFAMGSPGSAQVTRCRLLSEWNHLKAWTVGKMLYLELEG